MSEFQCPGKPVGQRLGEIPAGEATELPSGFGWLLWDMAVESAPSEQRRDGPDAWALEPAQ